MADKNLNINLLIIDDDYQFYTAFREQYEATHVFEYARKFERGLDLIKTEKIDAVLLDLQFPPYDYDYGLKKILPEAVKYANRRFPVLVVSGDDRRDTVSKALKAGASRFLSKSEYNSEEWENQIHRTIRIFKDRANGIPETPQNVSSISDGFITHSPAMEEIKQQLQTLVRYPHVPILIQGESGVGKEAAVRYLHAAKNDPRLPLKIVNVAALSKDLVDSELFGHVEGAFTGAVKDKVGYFESARRGTLMLDEIGDISLEMQAKLLTVLGNRTFQKVGSPDDLKLEAQLVFATHINLEEAVSQGRMRTDFYARISNRIIRIPPLCDRQEEIIPLIEYYLPKTFNHPEHPLYGKPPLKCFTREALRILTHYDWPTNIRQLQGVLQDLVIEAETRGRSIIDVDLIPQQFKFPGRTTLASIGNSPENHEGESVLPSHGWPIDKTKFYSEMQEIARALKQTGGRKFEAAERLGMRNDQNIRSRILACKKKFPELLESFPIIKRAYKI